MFLRKMMIAVLVMSVGGVLFAGNLNPPAAPSAGGTMKTLDEVEPRIPICQADLPLSISQRGSYYFTESMSFGGVGLGTRQAAINIITDDVTIDMMGFSLINTNGTNCKTAICGENRQRIVIRNGVVKYWDGTAIYLAGSSAELSRVENIRAYGSDYAHIWMGRHSVVRNCLLENAIQEAVRTGDNCLIEDCIVRNTADYSTTGIVAGNMATIKKCSVFFVKGSGIAAGTSSRIVNCGASYCDGRGIGAMQDSIISGCTTDSCATGIRGESECLLENNVVNGGNPGLFIGYGSVAWGNVVNDCSLGIDGMYRCKIEDNQIEDCYVGIEVEAMCSIKNNHITDFISPAIQVNLYRNVIEGNTIIDTSATSGVGIRLDGDRNLYLNNRVSCFDWIENNGSSNSDGGGNKTF